MAVTKAASVASAALAVAEATEQSVTVLKLEPMEDMMVHALSVYTVTAHHPPQTIALDNGELRGIVSGVYCAGPCKLVLREADGGRVLVSIDAASFDSPLSIAFEGPLVADLKTASSVEFSIKS